MVALTQDEMHVNVRAQGHAESCHSRQTNPPAVPGAGVETVRSLMARQIRRPIAPATSAMRQEKPHSLSYQASTRTVRPPTTLVWSGAKIDE